MKSRIPYTQVESFYNQFQKLRILLLIVAGISINQLAFAQSAESSREHIEDIIERAVAELDPETSENQIIELIERLENLANNPVNINRAGLDELSGVPGLNLQTAQAIIRYRDSIKPFEATIELIEVDGIGQVTLNNR
jgi:competence ComEA-like helix-hairpin-helix protein